MIRTKNKKSISYNPSDEPIVLSKPLLDTLLSQDKPSDLIALYSFYYYTAKWQKTNQPYSTTSYTAKGLGWTVERVRKNKKILKELKLIDDIQTQNDEGKINGHYIKVNFIWSKDNHPTGKPPYGLDHTMGNQGINALSSNNKNALSSNNKILPDKKPDKFTPLMFRLAEQLSTIIQSNKNIRHTPSQITSWAKEVYYLVHQTGVSTERIQRALDWYSDHIGEKYVPVIESGKSLREKFIKLEAAIERDKETMHQIERRFAIEIIADHFMKGKEWERWHKYCFKPLIALIDSEMFEERKSEFALAICKLHTWYTARQKVPDLTGREGEEIYGRWQAIPDAFEVVERFIEWLGAQSWIGEIYPAHLHPEGAVFQQFLAQYQRDVGLNFFDGSSI